MKNVVLSFAVDAPLFIFDSLSWCEMAAHANRVEDIVRICLKVEAIDIEGQLS